MEFQFNTQPVASGFEAVADALRGKTLSLMSIQCSELGSFLDTGNLCTNDVTPPSSPPKSIPDVTPPSSPPKSIPDSNSEQLAFGRYTFVDLKAAAIDASFAMDVRDMFDAHSSNDAKIIYTDGANALESKLFGDTDDGTPTLASH